MDSTASGVARSPAMIVAGSPSSSATRTTPSSVGTVVRSRRETTLSTTHPPTVPDVDAPSAHPHAAEVEVGDAGDHHVLGADHVGPGDDDRRELEDRRVDGILD